MIKFGDWLPDQPDMGGAGVINAQNVIPSVNGYRSVNSFTSFSNAGTTFHQQCSFSFWKSIRGQKELL